MIKIAMMRNGFGPVRHYMLWHYKQAVKRAGAEPVVLRITSDSKYLSQAVDQYDGFIFCGGPDVDPSFYKEARDSKCEKSEIKRDRAELKLMELVLKADKPLLAICRGEQLMNVFFGGSLHQDLGEVVPTHSKFKERKSYVHKVKLTADSRLAQICQTDALEVNSIHHQAVKDLAPELLVNAVSSDDGIIEGIEHPGYKFCLGVQWHPEHLAHMDAKQQALFDHLVLTAGHR